MFSPKNARPGEVRPPVLSNIHVYGSLECGTPRNLILAGLALAIGFGFWKLQNWSRIPQIVLLFLFAGFQLLAVLRNHAF